MGCVKSKNVGAGSGGTDDKPKEKAKTFSQLYVLGEKLGSGSFSVVKKATRQADGVCFAVKCIEDTGLSEEDKDALELEVLILKEMDHKNIMKLEDYFLEDNQHYLVTEMLEGGELFDRIVEKEYYTEGEARKVVRILLDAVAYIHTKGVVHRDLKPENLLLQGPDNDWSIKIADFGFAKRMNSAELGLSTACGTPGYVAPEILEALPYSKGVDVWSVGIITYVLLCGYPPFHHENHNQLFKMIKKGKFAFDPPYWDEVSDQAKKFVSRMLVVDPEKRASAEELKNDPWVQGAGGNSDLSGAQKELKAFNARRKFRSAVATVQAANRFRKFSFAECKVVT